MGPAKNDRPWDRMTLSHLLLCTDRLASLSEVERKSAYYNSKCGRPVVDRSMIERMRSASAKQALPDDSSSVLSRGPGRPST